MVTDQVVDLQWLYSHNYARIIIEIKSGMKCAIFTIVTGFGKTLFIMLNINIFCLRFSYVATPYLTSCTYIARCMGLQKGSYTYMNPLF